MIYQKHTTAYKLTNITQARMFKRSLSNNVLPFQPIKLKNLQDARNEAKSSTSRKFSLTPSDFDSVFTILPKPESLEKISEVKNKGPETEESPKRVSRQLVMEKRKLNVFRNNNFREKAEVEVTKSVRQSLKKSPNRVLSGQMETRVAGGRRSISKPKLVNSITTVLDIIESDRNKNKKLTKDQEKGLINRLQGKSLFKFG